MKKNKDSLNTRKIKNGAYATLISAVVIIITIFINLLFSKIDLQMDLTSDKKYSLTDETKELLAGVEHDITIYYLESSDSQIDIFTKIINQFDKVSKNVKVVVKDTVLYPKFASEYTSEEIEANSVIVVDETTGRSRYIPYSDMVIEEYNFDYNTYSYTTSTTGIDIEGQIVSAMGYVMSEALPTVYEVSGHGEQELGSGMIDLLQKANINVMSGDDSLLLLTLTEIPEDCDVILIQTPQNDYTEDEVALLRDYLENGGKLIVVAGYINADHANFLSLLSDYGLTFNSGVIFEGSSRKYMQAPYAVLPSVTSNSYTEGLSNKYVVAYYSSAFTVADEAPEGVTYTTLLKSSSNSYIKATNASTYYKEDGDQSGSFYIGVAAENSDNNSELVLFSSLYMFDDTWAANTAYGNPDLLVNTVNTLTNATSSAPTIRQIDLTTEETITFSTNQMYSIGAIVIFVIPLLILIWGIIVVVRRKKST